MKNWRARVPIAILLIAAIVGSTYADAASARAWIGPFLTGLLGFGALAEFFKMNPDARPGAPRLLAYAAAAFVAFAAPLAAFLPRVPDAVHWIAVPTHVAAMCVAAALAGFAALVLRRSRTAVEPADLREGSAAAVGLALTVVPLSCLGAIATIGGPQGPWFLLATVLLTKLNDIGGYVFGGMFGGPKLCPGTSPGKTWAGAVGGLILGVLGGWWALTGLPHLNGALSTPEILGFGILVSLAGQLGDLCESLVKRASGVKDSAALLPAFGGVFDLVDSFILAGPVGYTLLRLWAA